MRRLSLLALPLLLTTAALFAGPAAAAQVAYVDGGQIWVSTLDGSQKRSLSGPSPDAKTWTEVAQADGGTVIGVRREPGKIATLNATTLWGPDGAVIGNGALTSKPGWSLPAFPVTLDLTPDGKVVAYGYAHSRLGGSGLEFDFGTYVESSSNWYLEPIQVNLKSGTLAGNRLVGYEGSTVLVQEPDGAPYGPELKPWFTFPGVSRVDVAANGTVAAAEQEGGAVAMVPVGGLGGTLPGDGSDCMLPTSGPAGQVSISPDATSMAWHDDRGVVVAGTPVWFPSPEVSTCNLSRPPVVISATGKMPSIGASTAATPPLPPAVAEPPKRKAPAPSFVKPPAKLKATALKGGVVLKLRVAAAGPVTATGKVGGKLVARGGKRAKGAGVVGVRLKAVKAYRGKLAGLAGKKLKVKVRAGGEVAARTFTLR